MGNYCGKILWEILAEKFLWENIAGKYCGKISIQTPKGITLISFDENVISEK